MPLLLEQQLIVAAGEIADPQHAVLDGNRFEMILDERVAAHRKQGYFVTTRVRMLSQIGDGQRLARHAM